jgi:hypothetical protein
MYYDRTPFYRVRAYFAPGASFVRVDSHRTGNGGAPDDQKMIRKCTQICAFVVGS